MKNLILAATLAALSVSVAAPLQAAATGKSLATLTNVEFGRHGCDTAHDIKQRPRCTK